MAEAETTTKICQEKLLEDYFFRCTFIANMCVAKESLSHSFTRTSTTQHWFSISEYASIHRKEMHFPFFRIVTPALIFAGPFCDWKLQQNDQNCTI